MEMTEWMVNSGITQAAGFFWDSDVFTELSNGKIEMWTIQWTPEDPYLPMPWLQDISHAEHFPEGKMYVVYNVENDGPMENCRFLSKGEPICEIGNLSLWEFASAEDVFGEIAAK